MREIENIKEFIELQISGAEESTKERHASVESILFSEGYIKACRMILHYMKKLNKKYEIQKKALHTNNGIYSREYS